MGIYRYPQPSASEITPKELWLTRRRFMTASAMVAGGLASPFAGSVAHASVLAALPAKPNPEFMSVEKVTDRVQATTYNNFYEFGMDKSDPERYAGQMKVSPWSVKVEGEVAKPGTFAIEDLLALEPMQERIYRLRCVEGWSMVIPWIGYPLSALLNKVEPTGNAKYVEFITDMQPDVMRGLTSSVIDWPYREGLRMDEAMHPLTLLTFGMYGEVLPNQNGAPVRIVVPWKYGFKSAKSIVSIRVTEEQPTSSWMQSAPREYGFYSNVNPDVPHPRWSQATERRIGEGGLFAPRRKTLMFNGYEEQVASMYSGMDLAKFY
ncbi:MAG: protein-methionine-sulfoxide reductase catalytic subunit MsrP [Burkholderiaceae bacterium]|nr:protein-methionine-sulfoxide reductase catalytic subunit MsrP [Burkholderiaceae bacterium]MCD8517551.1 protein-methionine-sulfoxide reductase catalytic subunit MsrP [Burkholderiaceae bacterium]MCD8537933.1 protein-methionine-sulfoxide reductase catalytic subunit MsrP [Burkholderiaceae bacterium]MCD8565872.1 protein-methionine-sulfoxide reductase catalytic subunit MsrP [Burkholderiaceae bacterium]